MILDNLNQIRYRVRVAAKKAGRDPNAVRLVAVTKYAKLDQVRELLESGEVSDIGENRVQDALAKKAALGPLGSKVAWRMIGHLQTNKAKQALEVFDAVDSVDSLKLAEGLEKRLAAENRRLPVLIQVKLTEKDTQAGISSEELEGLLNGIKKLPHVAPEGLMAIAPNLEPVEAVRPHFRRMRELCDRFFKDKPGAQLSMGMSRDFEIAVEEGATLVRIGSALFS